MMIPTANTGHHASQTRSLVSDVLRAEALFASTLQPSESPSGDHVRHAVTATLRRLGSLQCMATVAGEVGDHPECAAARMTWALATVRAVYPPHGEP